MVRRSRRPTSVSPWADSVPTLPGKPRLRPAGRYFATIVAAVRAGSSHIREHQTVPHVPPDRQRRGAGSVRRLGALGRPIPLALGVLQILALDIGTDILPRSRSALNHPASHALDRPPLGRHLVDRPLLARIFGVFIPHQGDGGVGGDWLATFLAIGWRPGDPFPTGPDLMAGIRRRVHGCRRRPVRQRLRVSVQHTLGRSDSTRVQPPAGLGRCRRTRGTRAVPRFRAARRPARPSRAHPGRGGSSRCWRRQPSSRPMRPTSGIGRDTGPREPPISDQTTGSS